jgi:hypothetical protein
MVLGSATVLTQNPRFMTVKPIIVHLAVAALMLRRGWMIRYLPEIVRCPSRRSLRRAMPGRSCSRLSASPNLIIAWHSDFVTWAWFVSVGSVGAKLAAFALRYGVFRAIIR